MYVSTFYSFKGGVGRTMALVNVAVELVRKGCRVIAVDFDLEAPGLDTFDLGRPDETTPGVIDFVETFLATDRAPDARDFLFESPAIREDKGRLWVMPSGAQDRNYAQRLTALDWGDIYEHDDGFLLFEDLKEQWYQNLQADYVLIDSRTGYTDVGGICTRQLPDAVVLLFFPNQQNLRGLTKIVRDIRAEAEGPRNKAIDLHFVLSNVPDLDDEDEILRDIKRDFRDQLAFAREPLAIHRYPSLSLLKQDIFTKDRPRSRLAHEYRTLAAEVTRLNPADREGALDYIRRYEIASARRRPKAGDRGERQLERIEQRHADDGEVLFHLARLRDRQGSIDESADLSNRAIEAGYRKPEAYLERARQRRWQLDDPAGASRDALAVLRSATPTFPEVSMALQLLVPEDLNQVPECAAVQELPASERILLAMRMTRSLEEAELARSLIEPLLATGDLESDDLSAARQTSILAYLALGRFEEAATTLRTDDSSPSEDTMTVQDAFNYGMAVWAQTRVAPRPPFERVVELDASDAPSSPSANYSQCLALAHWAVGDEGAAKEALVSAQSQAKSERSSFSCWQYLEVPARYFVRDLQEMREMIDGDESIAPRFMRRPRNEQESSLSSDSTE